MTALAATQSSRTADARQLRTRRALFEALLTLLEQDPFEQITIRAIAAQADIGYATFFRHFASKEALLHELASGEIRELIERTAPTMTQGETREASVTLFEFLDEHRRLWTALLTGGAAPTLKQEFIEQTLRLAEENAPKGEIAPGELRVVTSVAATIELIAWWLRQDDVPIARIAEAHERLVMLPALSEI